MNREQRFTDEEYKNIYSQVPRVTVDLVVKNSQGILLSLRKKYGWEGQWHLPGGTIYLGETVMDAVARVAQEELGIAVAVQEFLGYNEYPSELTERGFGYSISLVFLCSPLSKEIVLDAGAGDYKFFASLPENTIAEQKEFLLKNLPGLVS